MAETTLVGCNTFKDFAEIVRQAVLRTYGAGSVGFVAAYPKDTNVPAPLITYKLIRSNPFGWHGGEHEIKPRLRHIEKEPLCVTEYWGQRIEGIMRFDVWAADGQAADELIDSFESLMAENTGIFKRDYGIEEIIWRGQVNDDKTKEWNTDLINRTVTYLVIFDKITLVKYPTIQELTATVDPVIPET